VSRTAPPKADGRFLVFAGVIIAAFAALLIAGAVMGITMADQMGSGGMMGHMNRAGNSGQTPVTVDTPELQIEIRGFEFFPSDVSIRAGTKVTWINRDSAPHTATERQGDWDTGVLKEGQSATLTFDKPGVYDYICAIHPSMQAKLTVR
jgi:plastocyanin